MPRSLRPALLLVGFALLTFLVSRPLVCEPDTLLGRIGPTWIDLGDGMAFLGYVSRSAEALRSSEVSVWQVAVANPNFTAPPAYLYPAGALSLVFGSTVLAHNVLMLLYTFLAFVCMYAFVLRISGSALAAGYASLFFGSSNYLLHHLAGGHANQVQVFLFPLVLLAVERVLDRPGGSAAFGLGAALALCLHSSSQYAVFLSLLLPIYVAIRAPERLRDRDGLRALTIAVVTAVVLSAHYLSAKLGSGTIERSLSENQGYSIHSLAEIVAPDGYAHLGLVPLVLAGLAVASRATPRRTVTALAVVLLLSIVLMLGPASPLHPYRWLYETVPVFRLMRTPVRFAAPAHTALLALAGIGVAQLAARFAARPRARAAVVALAFVASFVATPLLAPSYHQRAPEAGHIWTVDVRDHPQHPERPDRAAPNSRPASERPGG